MCQVSQPVISISFRETRNSRLLARLLTAAACPGVPGRFGSGLRSPPPAVEDPWPLRLATTFPGHRHCAIALYHVKKNASYSRLACLACLASL